MGSGSRRFYTTSEVAKRLGVTPPTVIKWVDEGALSAHRTPGGHRRILDSDLADFAARCGYGAVEGTVVSPRSDDGLTRVLIIDREQDFAEMVAEFLQYKGTFRVAHATNAMMAGFHVGTLQPEVVLYDVDFTEIDIHVLMGLSDSGRLLLMTSLPSSDVLALESSIESSQIVEKPVKLDHLLKIIQGR